VIYSSKLYPIHFLEMAKNSEKYFTCDICEKKLASNQLKYKHITVVHGGEKKLFAIYAVLPLAPNKN